MRNFSVPLFTLGVIATAAATTPALAVVGMVDTAATKTNGAVGSIIHQTQFKISGSKTRKRLRNQGYSEIQIEHRGVSKVIATACKGGEKFRLRVGRSGKVRSSEKIGYCAGYAPRITRAEVVDYLKTSGYHHIDVTSDGPPHYKVEACERRQRFDLTIDDSGSIVNRRAIGRCGESHRPVHLDRPRHRGDTGLTLPRRVMDRLFNKGFSNFIIFDDSLPEYGLEACKNGRRFELTTNARGQILRRERIGRCEGDERPYARGITQEEAKQVLRDQGFRRIRFTNKGSPNFVAKACRDGRRFRVTVDRSANIADVRRLGRCFSDNTYGNLNPKEVRYHLRARGFNRINFISRTPPVYRVEACRNDRRVRLSVDRSGTIVDRTKIGSCTDDDDASGYVGNDIKAILESRRYYNIKLKEKSVYTARVCRNGREFRLKVDRYGNELKRKRIGWCESPNYGDRRYNPNRFDRQRISDADLDARDRLAPSRCQDYIDWLLENNSINFDTASARINPESVPLLKRLAHVANRCPATTIEIAGHTDSDGSDGTNQILSERRAQSVVDFLRNHNVERSRLSAVGYGETKPLVPNDSPWNKALNRRIEFVVTWADDWRYSQR